MKGPLITAAIAVAAIGYILMKLHKFIISTWLTLRVWRFLTGEAHHGKPITDAGWFRPGVKALTPTGHATRWRHLPRYKRTAHRTGGTVAAVLVAAAWIAAPHVTADILLAAAALAVAGAAWLGWRSFLQRKDRKTWQHPLHLAIHEKAGIAKATRATSYIKLETDKTGAVKAAKIELPQGWPADEKEREWLLKTAATKLGLEAPDTDGSKLSGPSPFLKLTRSEPPPANVRYEDVAELVERAHANELVTGLGKRKAPVLASLSLADQRRAG